jgi:long-chain fatty acid transport protein
MNRPSARLGAAALLVGLAPTSGLAQGFGVFEHGTCAMGRAGTGVAAPCGDGSAIFFNPAGLAAIDRLTLTGGLTLIQATGSFTDDLLAERTGLDNSPIPVPHVFAAYPLHDRVTAGLGLFVPYGLSTNWPADFDGRFNGYDNALQSIYIQPTVAFRPIDIIQIGGGLDVVIGSVKLTQRLDLSEFEAVPGITFGQLGVPFHTDFADATLETHGATGVTGNFGVIIAPHDRFSIGFRYLGKTTLEYEGDATFDPIATGIVLPPGNPLAAALGLDPAQSLPLDLVLNGADLFSPGAPLEDQTVHTRITMPDQIVVGFALRPAESFTLLFDYQRVNWSTFDVLSVDFENTLTPDREVIENYEDTDGFRFGVDIEVSPRWDVRAGYLWHEGAAPPQTVTPLLPEGTRNELTIGFGWRISDAFTTDVAYQYIRQDDRRGRVTEGPPGQAPTVDLNSGLYTFKGHLVGFTVTWRP